MPMAMKDGGAIKAQSGLFADISGAIGSAFALKLQLLLLLQVYSTI